MDVIGTLVMQLCKVLNILSADLIYLFSYLLMGDVKCV